ncbi:hypothetical protein QU755_13660, partial [Pseudomonas wenzhouensis]
RQCPYRPMEALSSPCTQTARFSHSLHAGVFFIVAVFFSRQLFKGDFRQAQYPHQANSFRTGLFLAHHDVRLIRCTLP